MSYRDKSATCVHCIFFFNDTATTEIYTLSLHGALPISHDRSHRGRQDGDRPPPRPTRQRALCQGRGDQVHRGRIDRKSTRLNSSHANISYAVFCLKKKKLKRCINTRAVGLHACSCHWLK